MLLNVPPQAYLYVQIVDSNVLLCDVSMGASKLISCWLYLNNYYIIYIDDKVYDMEIEQNRLLDGIA